MRSYGRQLEQLDLSELNSLRGLRLLLEKSPEELRTWAQDMSVPGKDKTEVLTVLEEEVPDAWMPTLSAFISTAEAMVDGAVGQDGEVAYFCERLLLLLLGQERLLPRFALVCALWSGDCSLRRLLTVPREQPASWR